MKNFKLKTLIIAMFVVMLWINASASEFRPSEEDVKPPTKEYSPYVEDHFPNRVYFGIPTCIPPGRRMLEWRALL